MWKGLISQRCSKEKWSLIVLGMFKQRVNDHQLGNIMEEIQALDGMLDKMLLKMPYNHADTVLT